MNTCFQIAIGLAPIEIFLIVYAFRKEAFRTICLVVAAALGVCLITALSLGFQDAKPVPDAVIQEKEAVQQLDVIYTVATHEGGVTYASQLLSQLREEATDSGRITLCDAYLRGAQGDCRSAAILYEKAVQMGEDEDPSFADACRKTMAYTGTLTEGQPELRALQSLAQEEILRRSADSTTDAGRTAALLVESRALFDTCMTTGTLDKEKVSRLASEMTEVISDNESLLRMREVRNCRTKLLVLSGSYGAIAGNIDENATYSELAIAAELYLMGMVKDADFQDDYVDDYKMMSEAVALQLQVVLKEVEDVASADEINSLISELTAADPSALQILRDAISDIAADGRDPNKPKAHIQLARIAHYYEKNDQAMSEISGALEYLGISRDAAFYKPMQNLAELLNDRDSGPETKTVSAYVAEVLANTTDPLFTDAMEDLHRQESTTVPEVSEKPDAGPEKPSQTPSRGVTAEAFAAFMSDTIYKLHSAVNITAVDAAQFPKVVIVADIDAALAETPEKLKSMLLLHDCGTDIEDFTAEQEKASDPASLSSEGQHYRYIITYDAKETLRTNRKVKLTLTGDVIFAGSADYFLKQSATDAAESGFPVTMGSKGVTRLDTGLILKNSSATKVRIYGFGFGKDEPISVELEGKQTYGSDAVSCVYVDDSTLEMTLPGYIACDSYDINIHVGALSTTLRDGITVMDQEAIEITQYGPYRFTSWEKTQTGGVIILSGNVTLNDWLVFKGDVILQKSDSDVRELTLTDSAGAYINFYPDVKTGLAGLMAGTDQKLSIPALGEVTLVSEPLTNPGDDTYPVHGKKLSGLHIANVMDIKEPDIALYPYKLDVRAEGFTTALPMQSQLLSLPGVELYTFDVAVKGSISGRSIDLRAEHKGAAPVAEAGQEIYRPANLGAVPIYIAPSAMELLMDTAANEYKLSVMAKVSFLDGEGLKLRLQWNAQDVEGGKQRLAPGEVVLKADTRIPGQLGTVPVTYSDFTLGLADIDPDTSILQWKLTGGFQLTGSQLGEWIPGLEDTFGNPAILTMNPQVELSLGQGGFRLNTGLKLLETMEFSNVTLETGKIPASTVVLGFESQVDTLMDGTADTGIVWEMTDCAVNVGTAAGIYMDPRSLDVRVTGQGTADIGWSIFRARFSEQGTVAVGFRHIDDMPSFVMKVIATGQSKNADYCLIWNQESQAKTGKLEV